MLVQLDDELVERLDRLADEQGTNRSELLAAVPPRCSRLPSWQQLTASSRRRTGGFRKIRPSLPPRPACRANRAGVVARGDVVWADLGPPAGRRPVCVLTRDARWRC